MITEKEKELIVSKYLGNLDSKQLFNGNYEVSFKSLMELVAQTADYLMKFDETFL